MGHITLYTNHSDVLLCEKRYLLTVNIRNNHTESIKLILLYIYSLLETLLICYQKITAITVLIHLIAAVFEYMGFILKFSTNSFSIPNVICYWHHLGGCVEPEGHGGTFSVTQFITLH